jgi:hypothetical protein
MSTNFLKAKNDASSFREALACLQLNPLGGIRVKTFAEIGEMLAKMLLNCTLYFKKTFCIIAKK